MSEKKIKIISLVLVLFLLFNTVSPALASDGSKGIVEKIKDKVKSTVDTVKGYFSGDDEKDTDDTKESTDKKGLLSDIDTITKKKEDATPENRDTEIPLVDELTKKETTSLEDAKVNDSDNKDEEEEEYKEDGEDDHFSTLDAGVQMVAKGVWLEGLKLLAEEGFKVGMSDDAIEELNIKENYGQTVAVIYAMATVEFSPLENEFIQEIHMRLNVIAVFLIFMFVILGALDVNICAAMCAQNRSRAYILANRYHLPVNEYAVTMIEGFLMLGMGYAVLWVIAKTEVLFTSLIMLQILDRIMPTGDSVIMYVMMSICYIVMGIALAIRILVIAIFSAGYLVFVALYCYAVTRDLAISAFWYFVRVTFLRTAIVGITVIGVGVISQIKVSTGPNPFLQVGKGLLLLYLTPMLYVGLMIILIILSTWVLFGIKNIVTTTRRTYRKIKGGYYL